jgi:hypothetical protein
MAVACRPDESHSFLNEQAEVVKELVAAIAEWEKGTIAPIFQSPRAGKPAAKNKKK